MIGETPAESDLNLVAIIDTIPTTAWTTRPDGYCDFINRNSSSTRSILLDKLSGIV